MLTIKHIRFDGAETIDMARRVLWYPETNEAGPASAKGVLTIITPTNDGFDYDNGTVYVMNEQGKTVARYEMVDVQAPMPSGKIG